MASTRVTGAALATLAWWSSRGLGAVKPPFKLPARLAVEFPVSKAVFPPGAGVDLANAFCLMCHSADMVERQPPLTRTEWTTEIVKMQHVYGAPVADEQIPLLAAYFTALNGRAEPAPPEAKPVP